MTQIQFNIDPPGQVLTDYYTDRSRVSMIMGPLGSAKTYTTILKILRLMMDQKPNKEGVRLSRWWAIRNTYSDLENTTCRDWLAVTAGLGIYKGTYPMSHKLKFKLEDGTTVQGEMLFLALDRPDSIKKLRGTQATGFWMNEAKELPRAVIDMADLRHGRYPSMADGGCKPSWHGMVGDYNAPDEDHWLYEMAEEIRPEDWTFFIQPGGVFKHDGDWTPNPQAENLSNLPEEYYIKGMQGKREDWISVNLANEYGFVRDGKPVWPEYIDGVHCARDILEYDPRLPVYIGIDFGLTPAATFGQLNEMGQWRIIDELVTDNMGTARFALELKRKIAQYRSKLILTGDPAGEQRAQTDENTPFNILRSNGVNALPAQTNDPSIRIESVSAPLTRMAMDGGPGFLLSPVCKHLRKAMAGAYCYRRIQVVGDERYKDTPDKNMYSHVSDALQYMMLGGGEGNKVLNTGLDKGYTNYNPNNHYDPAVR